MSKRSAAPEQAPGDSFDWSERKRSKAGLPIQYERIQEFEPVNVSLADSVIPIYIKLGPTEYGRLPENSSHVIEYSAVVEHTWGFKKTGATDADVLTKFNAPVWNCNASKGMPNYHIPATLGKKAACRRTHGGCLVSKGDAIASLSSQGWEVA